MDGASQWAAQLGMAISPLFSKTGILGHHYAMLDGRRASFACSLLDSVDVSQESSRNWQWSADLAHHVLLTPHEVHVRSGRDSHPRLFLRASVENQLEEFLRFLDSSRAFPLPDVVSFLVEEFRRIWAVNHKVEGYTALATFLLALHAADKPDALRDAGWRRDTAADIGINEPALEDTIASQQMIEEACGIQDRAPLGLRLIPSLVLRHAAGRLFQEAHAILESAEQLALFGDPIVASVPTYSPAAAYFTPVPLARLLADWTLQRLPNIRDHMTIADYACGSGVFLAEALRALDRRGFHGTVSIVGRDSSEEAITMAKVAIHAVRRDMPGIDVRTDIVRASAFDSEWPKADVILMNPPFRSWERMNEQERQWVMGIIGNVGRYRPDLSVGFIERAFRSLAPSGLLATLAPAGVLSSEGLERWREQLLDAGTPSLIAVLGEHGLFEHALVNVALLVLEHTPSQRHWNDPVCIGWSSSETGAAARTIRAIRRHITMHEPSLAIDEDMLSAPNWSLNVTTVGAWKQRSSWLPGAGTLGSLLARIQNRVTTTVDDLFDVHQGMRTGANKSFIVAEKLVSTLPRSERRYFTRAVDGTSIVNGEIQTTRYVFMDDPNWTTEDDIRKAVPEFFKYLESQKPELRRRESVRTKHENDRWWALARPRRQMQKRARLISKRFGLYPAFARDLDAEFAVIQANAWIPTERLRHGRGEDVVKGILTPYWWILNSRIATALFREFCPNVAGGQLDLEHKYVKRVPLPDLLEQLEQNPAMQNGAASMRAEYGERLPSVDDRDRFAALAFGTVPSEWNLSGITSSRE